MYDAMDIAEYVLNYCNERYDKGISNSKLNRILYYIQKEYFLKYNQLLFDNDIEAWQYGMVIPDVYFWYSEFLSEPITNLNKTNDIKFKTNEITIINNSVEKYINMDNYELSRLNRQEVLWRENYFEFSKKRFKVNVNLEELKEDK